MTASLTFEGQVVLVTGASAGLGLATARAFGEAGAIVALNDRAEERVNAACATLEADGIRALPATADVRDAEAVEAMFARVIREVGAPRVVVANAGIYPNSRFLDISHGEWDAVIGTNLTGMFHTCQSAARAMVAAGIAGRIITLSSGAANRALHGWAHYSASKAGVVALTRSMAMELAPWGIRANAVLPGYIDVGDGGAHLSPTYRAAMRSSSPLGRPGTPEDIANAIVMLASPLADYISGTTLVVDGGASAGAAGLWPVEPEETHE